MVTLHPTAKKVSGGYVPMVTLRGAGGRMIGSKCPQGPAREASVHLTAASAAIDARLVALRLALKSPELVCVAE